MKTMLMMTARLVDRTTNDVGKSLCLVAAAAVDNNLAAVAGLLDAVALLM